ncbi:MAG TPA: hypothetical protein VIX73_34565, partial [Kofleriaceae bacterium]
MRSSIIIAVALAIALPVGHAAPRDAAPRDAVLEALSSGDRGRIEQAVAVIGDARDADPDVLFAAARACEDKLEDPGGALALYDRITGEHPSARV